MTGPAYPAARAVAGRVQEHFVRHLAAARQLGIKGLAPDPEVGAIESIIDAAFWASLRREEGCTPKISLALIPPEMAASPLELGRSFTLKPANLSRIAPAVERPGVHLGVWPDAGELRVWGTTRKVPRLCFVLEVIAPGLLVVKYRRGQDSGKFANVAVLEGDQIKVVDEQGAGLPDCPPLLASMLAFDSPSFWSDSFNVLVELAVSMREHGRGGALLVVPAGTGDWAESVLQPITYQVSPPFSELAGLARQEPEQGRQYGWREAMLRAVDAVAGLTAVDGATVINADYELLAFGAKIGRRDGGAQVEQVMVTEPVEGAEAFVAHPNRLGGTRHLSAAQFVHDQRDSIALVASQDGRFTVFAWSPCENTVHAHRVEALLL